MGSKSQQNKIIADAADGAASTADEPQTVNDTPVSTSSADNVLSTSEAAVTVGRVEVIEHEQENGEANEEHGGA